MAGVFFFFQAEDGIRDVAVTGVQTCALPILKLHHSMAPIKVAVLPLAKNKPEIVGMAKALKRSLQPVLRAVYDDTGGIGKLYARQDEIGTPFCITVDHQSLEDEAVTVRDRDTW